MFRSGFCYYVKLLHPHYEVSESTKFIMMKLNAEMIITDKSDKERKGTLRE